MNVDGTAAIVTGSSMGIGRAIAVELASRGAQVVCTARSEGRLRETVDAIKSKGGVALAVPTDVTDKSQVERMAEQTLNAFGKIDVLINNAAVFHGIGGLWEVDPDAWWADVKTKLFGGFLCCRAVLPHMIKENRGIIMNMAGGGYDQPNVGGTGYASASAGLMRLTDTLAAELGDAHNIQVYGLWPGFVRSEMTEILATAEQGQRWLPHVKKGLSLGQDHAAEDVALAVIKIIEHTCPALSGRIVSYEEDFEQIVERADAIRERDLYQLRLRSE